MRDDRFLLLWSSTTMPAAQTNLDAARQKPQEQIVVREQVKRSLEGARVMIPMLETQLQWIAQGEPLSQTDDQRHKVEASWRRSASIDNGRSRSVKALSSGREADEWLREVMAAQVAQKAPGTPGTTAPRSRSRQCRSTNFSREAAWSQQGLAGYRLNDERPIPRLRLCPHS